MHYSALSTHYYNQTINYQIAPSICCMQFCTLSFAFFSSFLFLKYSFKITIIKASNSMDPDHAWPAANLCPNCLQSITPYLLVLSADNLCKQFEPRSGPTKATPVLLIASNFPDFDGLNAFFPEIQQAPQLPLLQKGRHKVHFLK